MADPSNENRRYDVVVFGATGFTGGLVVEYFAEHHTRRDVRWAIAGRNSERLHELRDRIVASHPTLDPPPVVVADSKDPDSLNAMAASTKVVCTTVGPYARYGAPLVAACIEQGSHVVDLTGEPQFVRHSVDSFHEAAVEAGVRVVHCCGFDSIPSDLGTRLLQDAVIARDGRPCDEIKLFVVDLRGAVSGGTIESMVGLMEAARSPAVRRILGDPYALNPAGERHGPDRREPLGPDRDPLAQTWTAPFVMAAINSRVVRRTNALLDFPYGRSFRYQEVMATGSGAMGWLRAASSALGLGLFLAGMRFDPSRALLRRWVLPEPGRGPSRARMEAGRFAMRLSARRDGSEVGSCVVRGSRDPGYLATAGMIAEAAVHLASDEEGSRCQAGVLTPVTGLGPAITARLERAGLEFELQV